MNIKIANYLDDPLPVAADDGLTAAQNTSTFLASQRNQAVNESLAWLVQECVNRYGIEQTAEMLQGAIATQSVTFSSAGVTTNKDMKFPYRLIDSSGNVYKRMDRVAATTDDEFFNSYVYSIDGGKLYAYLRTAGTLTLQNSGTGTFYYLKADRKDTTSGADTAVNTAPDTTFDYRFIEAAVWYGCHLLAQAKGAGEWLEKNQQFLGLALEKFPK